MKTAARAEEFLLREYRRVDLEQLCVIDQQCFPKKIAYGPRAMREMIEEKDAITVVAEDAPGLIAGFIVAGRTSPRIGHIGTLDVLSRFRRAGLATRLMNTAEARLSEMGVRKVRLETATGNIAQHLFEKLGYQRVGKIERYYPNGSDAWVMEKALGRTQTGPAETRPDSEPARSAGASGAPSRTNSKEGKPSLA